MNDQLPDTAEPLLSEVKEGPSGILPQLTMTSCIEGPCFSLEVTARREYATLVIQRMRVIARSLEGIGRAAYVFSARIDAAGVQKLAPLLVHIHSVKDMQFLQKILQATEGHSAGYWSIEPLDVAVTDSSCGLLHLIPSFEDFCKDIGVLSREFWCPRHQGQQCDEKLEARISGGGEFVELRIFARTRGHDSWDTMTHYWKALLPDEPCRSLNDSFRQVKLLLEEFARAYTACGSAGIYKRLSAHNLTAVHGSYGQQEGQTVVNLDDRDGLVLPDIGTIAVPSIRASIRYQISPENADISLYSDNSPERSLVDIHVSPSQTGKIMGASHIRCCLGLFKCLRDQRWTPINRFEQRSVQKLVPQPSSAITSAQPLKTGGHSEDALCSVAVSATTRPARPEVFLTTEGCRQLMDNPNCHVPDQARSDPDFVEEALKGCQWIRIELIYNLRRQRPELFSNLTIFRFPDGSLKIHASSDLGFSLTGVTAGDTDQATHTSFDVCDALCQTLADQQHSGWHLMYDVLRTVALPRSGIDRHSLVMHNLPASIDESTHKSVEAAGRIASLLLRGGDYGLTCHLSLEAYNLWRLTVQSAQLRGAVDIIFDSSTISEMRFRYTSQVEIDRQTTWIELGTLKQQRTKHQQLNYDELIFCIRSYFRDRLTPEASSATNPESSVFKNIASLLRAEGFEELCFKPAA